MSEFSQLEQRLAAALDRIAKVAEAGQAAALAERKATEVLEAKSRAEATLREALEAERTANAQLNERVRAIKDRQETMVSKIERKLARATEQLDTQGLEIQRLRRANAQMAEANRRLIAAGESGIPDSNAANRALQAELDSMRAARRSEMAELEELMQELTPLIEEKSNG